MSDDINFTRPKKIVVIGVGQTMRGDDAIGITAVKAWQSQYSHTANHPGVCVEITELPDLDFLELLSGAEEALIVDAVKTGDRPGKIHILNEQSLSAFDQDTTSTHGWGVAETIRLGRTLKREDLPQEIKIIGIEAGQFETGARLTPEIIENLPQIIAVIEAHVNQLLQESHQNHINL
jgi:hydrogenase maturation protease